MSNLALWVVAEWPQLRGRAHDSTYTMTRHQRQDHLPPTDVRRHPTRGLEALSCLYEGGEMSERGWREFLAAEGVDDWVVLHGGATAVFRVPSLGEAARLAEAIAQVPGLEDSGALLTIADGRSACG